MQNLPDLALKTVINGSFFGHKRLVPAWLTWLITQPALEHTIQIFSEYNADERVCSRCVCDREWVTSRRLEEIVEEILLLKQGEGERQRERESEQARENKGQREYL